MQIKQCSTGPSPLLISPVVEQEAICIFWGVEDHVNVGTFGDSQRYKIEESGEHPSVVEFFPHLLKRLALHCLCRKIGVYVDLSPAVGQRGVLPSQPQYFLLHLKAVAIMTQGRAAASGGCPSLCTLSISIGVGK